jgi:diadenosine tetraphosphate (Ap4A) HIT family hydrolase
MGRTMEMNVEPPLHWTLHPRLETDAVAVGDLLLSRILIMNDANFPWLLLVPRCVGAIEIIDLAEHERMSLMAEIAQVAAALKTLTACDKLNIATIGNVVPQLHVHIIARRRGDPAWPKPVWGQVAPLDYDPRALAHFVETLRDRLWLD